MNNPTTDKAPAWAVRAAERLIAIAGPLGGEAGQREPEYWSRIIAEEAAPLTDALQGTLAFLDYSDVRHYWSEKGEQSGVNKAIRDARAALTT